jgi:hypothetical protein
MQNLWLDVLAGSIGAMMWAAGALWARREWLATHKFMPGFILFVFLAFGLFLFGSRAAYWAAENASRPIVVELR